MEIGRDEDRKQRGIQVLVLLLCTLLMTGCSLMSTESIKLRDLEYTVLSEAVIPKEVMTLIEEKQGEAFQFTFRDKENLYICIGYGNRETGGYQIVVDELYLTESAIYVTTTLLGPTDDSKAGEAGNPVIVIKTENLDAQVIYK